MDRIENSVFHFEPTDAKKERKNLTTVGHQLALWVLDQEGLIRKEEIGPFLIQV